MLCIKGKVGTKMGFVKVDINLIDAEIMEHLGNRVFRFLWKRIVRSNELRYDPCNLFNEYYKNDYLATAWSNKAIAKKLDISPASVSKSIKKLNDSGVVKTIKTKRYDPDIFIMGKKNELGREELYIEKLAKKELNLYKFDTNIDKNKAFEVMKKFNKNVKSIIKK
jgi:DNA-binding transcriptional regulator YhcF (GntR family)